MILEKEEERGVSVREKLPLVAFCMHTDWK